MKANYYKCDEKLECLIYNHRWVETTSKVDKLKGKKEFRRSPKARTIIRFDYINFVVFEDNLQCEGIGGIRIATEDIHLLFWYLNSSASDKHELCNGHFNLLEVRKAYETMTNLLNYAKEFNCITRESRKFERMLNNHGTLNLSSEFNNVC
jgi:hypothetical protein